MSGNSKSRFSLPLRAVSLTVALLFSVQTLLSAAPAVNPQQKVFQNFQISEELGRVEEAFLPETADSSKALIVHIRDAHAQPEAQRKIQAILNSLAVNKKIELVAAEAAFGPIDASVLKLLPDDKSNRAMAEDMADSGEVNGVELFALQNDHGIELRGVEDPELYRQSLQIFASLKKSKQSIKDVLSAYRTAVESLEARLLNPELQQYLIKKRSWEQNHDISLDYFRYLQTLARKKLNLDLSGAGFQFEWPQMVRLIKTAEMDSALDRERAVSETLQLAETFEKSAGLGRDYIAPGLRQLVSRDSNGDFRLWMLQHPAAGVQSIRHFYEALWRESKKQKISLLQYPEFLALGGSLILRDEIDAPALFSEAEKLERLIEKEIVRTEEEKKLFAISSDLALAGRLLSLELTRADYPMYLQRAGEFEPEVFRRRVQDFSGRKQKLPLLSGDLLEKASEFYRLSVLRDQTLIEKTLAAASGRPAALVAGGFHSEGLLEILKAKNIPYISITPKINNLADESLYEKAMIGSGNPAFAQLSVNTLGVQFLAQPARVYQKVSGSPSQTARLLRGLLVSGVRAMSSERRGSLEIYQTVTDAISSHPDIFGNNARVILREQVPVQLRAGKTAVDVLYLDIPSLGLKKELTLRNGRMFEVSPLVRFSDEQPAENVQARSETRISRKKLIAGAAVLFLGLGITGGIYEFNRRAEIARQEAIDASRIRYFKIDVPVRYTPNYDRPQTYSTAELQKIQKETIVKVSAVLGVNFDSGQKAHVKALADFYGLTHTGTVSPVMTDGDVEWWVKFSSNRRKISHWTQDQENEALVLQFFWRWQTREVMEHYGVVSKHQGDISAISEASDAARSLEPAVDALFIKATRNHQEIPAFIRDRKLRSEARVTRSPEELYVISEIVRLVSVLDSKGLRAKIHGRNLLEFGSHGEALVSFIQRYSVLKNLDDIRRVLAWRLDLESKSGLPLNGMDASKSAEKTRLIYESIFDPAAFLKHWAERKPNEPHPLNIVFFRRAQSGAEITNLLKSLPNVNVQIVLSATDDGLGWYEAARQFRATGVPGAGKALLDLAQDFHAKDFLAFRLSGKGKGDDEFTRDFTALVLKLHAPHDANLVLSDEMKIIFQKAMRMNIEKRRAMADYLETFLEEVQRRHRENADFTFRLKNIPLRSLVLLGASLKFKSDGELTDYWQKALDATAVLLDVKAGNRVIFPTRERQHLLAVREDGTVYFSETGVNRYGYEPPFLGYTTDSSFLGLWLVSETVDEAFIESIKSKLSAEGIELGDIPEAALPAEISRENRREVIATTKKVQPDQAARVAQLFSEMSTTAVSADSVNRVPVSLEADAAIRSADVVFYTTAAFETNVGAALIVPGVEDAIKQNRKAVKIALAEINGGNEKNLPLLALKNIERYLSHSPMGDLTHVQDHADFVLAGLLGSQDPNKAVPYLIETEQAAGGLVSAVALDARTDETHGFYSSPVLSEAMIALVGLKAADFRVSDSGGLMPDAKAVDSVSRENNQAGLFRKKKPVAALIREIKTNFPRIVKEGAFAFDVDMTLLPKNSDELTDYPELAYLLMRMLREGVTVSIISGNSFEEQGARILEAIKREMKDDFSALDNLVFYVSGGATRFNINKNGEVVPDAEYNRSHELNLDILKSGVNQALRELAAKNFGLNPDQLAAFISETQKKNGSHVTFPWKDGGVWEPEWLTPAEVKARKEKKQPLAFPWVEVRGDFITPGSIVASITVKPMQVFEYEGNKIDLRDEFQAHLRTLMFENQGSFVIRSGGTSSTDITTSTANKNVALENLIASRGLDAKWVFYFGDEFYQRQVAVSSGTVTQLGNDEAIALDPNLSAFRTLAVNSTDMKGASAKTIWIGRSPQATLEFLESVVINPAEISKRSEVRINFSRDDQAPQEFSAEVGIEGSSKAVYAEKDPESRAVYVWVKEKGTQGGVSQALLLPDLAGNDVSAVDAARTLADYLAGWVKAGTIKGDARLQLYLIPLLMTLDSRHPAPAPGTVIYLSLTKVKEATAKMRSEARAESKESTENFPPAFDSFIWPQLPQEVSPFWNPSAADVTFVNNGEFKAVLVIPAAVTVKLKTGGNTGPTLVTIIEASLRNAGYAPEDYQIKIERKVDHKVEIYFKKLLGSSRSEARMVTANDGWLDSDEKTRLMNGFFQNSKIDPAWHFITGVDNMQVVATLHEPDRPAGPVEADPRFFWPHVSSALWTLQWLANNKNEFLKDRGDAALLTSLEDWLTGWKQILLRVISNEGERDNAPQFQKGILEAYLYLLDTPEEIRQRVDWFGDVLEVTNGIVSDIFEGSVSMGAFVAPNAALSMPDAAYFYRWVVRGKVDLQVSDNLIADVPVNVARLAEATKKRADQLKIALLIRPRHFAVIEELIKAGIQIPESDKARYDAILAIGDEAVQKAEKLKFFGGLEKQSKEKGYLVWGNIVLAADGDMMPAFAVMTEDLDAVIAAGGPNEVLLGAMIAKIFNGSFKGRLVPADALKEENRTANITTAKWNSAERQKLLEHNLFPPDVTANERLAILKEVAENPYALNKNLTEAQRHVDYVWTQDEAVPGNDGVFYAATAKMSPVGSPWVKALKGIEFDAASGNVSVYQIRAGLSGDVRVFRVIFKTVIAGLRDQIHAIEFGSEYDARASRVFQESESEKLYDLYYALGRALFRFRQYEEAFTAFEEARRNASGNPGRLAKIEAVIAHYAGLQTLVREKDSPNEKALPYFIEASKTDHQDLEGSAGSRVLAQLLLKFLAEKIEKELKKNFDSEAKDKALGFLQQRTLIAPETADENREIRDRISNITAKSEVRSVVQVQTVELPKATEPLEIFRKLPGLENAGVSEAQDFIRKYHLRATVQYEGGSELELDDLDRSLEKNWKIGGDRKAAVRLRYYPFPQDKQTLRNAIASLAGVLVYALEKDYPDQEIEAYKIARVPTDEEPVTVQELKTFLDNLSVNLIYKPENTDLDQSEGWYFQIARKKEDLLYGEVEIGPFLGTLSEDGSARLDQGDLMLVYEILDARNVLDEKEVTEVGPEILRIFKNVSRSESRVQTEPLKVNTRFLTPSLEAQGRTAEDLFAVAETSTQRVFAQPDIDLAGPDFIRVQYGWDGAQTLPLSSEIKTAGKVSQGTPNTAQYGTARTVVLRGDTGITVEDLQAMDLQPGSRVIVVDEIGGPSFLWNRYASMKLPNNVRIERRSVLDALAYNEIKKVFAENPASVPVLILPVGTPDPLLESYQTTAERKGLVIASPRTADARRAMAWVVRMEADKLRQQIPDGLTFRFQSDALSPTSVQPGAENRFAKVMLAAVSTQRFQTAA